MTDLFYIALIEEDEVIADNVVMGADNAKRLFLAWSKNKTCTVDAHPVYYNENGIQLVDYNKSICW